MKMKQNGSARGVVNENGIPSSINENLCSTHSINVFPNPFMNDLNIVSISNINITFIEIVDIRGNIIKSQKFNNHQKTIDLHDLSWGIYLLRIYTNNNIIIKKIVKNNTQR